MDGNILDAQIATQITVLNQVYGPIGFSFTLQSTDRTVNADWFQNMVSGSSEESAAQSALHQGDMGTVRVSARALCRYCNSRCYCFRSWAQHLPVNSHPFSAVQPHMSVCGLVSASPA